MTDENETPEDPDDCGPMSRKYNSGLLEDRLEFSGLLPGQLWARDLFKSQPELISEWVDEPDHDCDDAGSAIHDAGVAQIRKLLPGSSRRDRKMVALGLLAAQSWLYVSALSMIDDEERPGRPAMPEPVGDMLAESEYQVGRLISMLYGMGNDVDMSAFEFDGDDDSGSACK